MVTEYENFNKEQLRRYIYMNIMTFLFCSVPSLVALWNEHGKKSKTDNINKGSESLIIYEHKNPDLVIDI